VRFIFLVFSSSQLDALRLDSELIIMLKDQMYRTISLFGQGFPIRFQPELDAILRTFILSFCLKSSASTPGTSLFGLEFRDSERPRETERVHPSAPPPLPPARPLHPSGAVESSSSSSSSLPSSLPAAESAPPAGRERRRSSLAPSFALPWGPPIGPRKKLLYVFLTVGVRYGWARLERTLHAYRFPEAPLDSWRHVVWRIFCLVEKLVKVATAANLIAFLYQGRYASLEARLLGLRIVPRDVLAPRPITFQFLNRSLLWEEVASTAYAAIPLLTLVGQYARGDHAYALARNAGALVREVFARARAALLHDPERPRGSEDDVVGQGGNEEKQQAENATNADAVEKERGDQMLVSREFREYREKLGGKGDRFCPACRKEINIVSGLHVVVEPCAHVYCFYCFQMMAATVGPCSCKLCGVPIKAVVL